MNIFHVLFCLCGGPSRRNNSGCGAGEINLETSFGEIETSMPVTVRGRISKDHIKGAIGQPALSGVEGGTGNLILKTSFGAIKLK